MEKFESFSSRWSIILVGLGMAVGTGNLWRFPRIVAQNGGAAFLIPWMLFLVLWSMPLMIAEFGLGRDSRRGPIGAFSTLIGKQYAWMGGFGGILFGPLVLGLVWFSGVLRYSFFEPLIIH